jgi:hypothetical protein
MFKYTIPPGSFSSTAARRLLCGVVDRAEHIKDPLRHICVNVGNTATLASTLKFGDNNLGGIRQLLAAASATQQTVSGTFGLCHEAVVPASSYMQLQGSYIKLHTPKVAAISRRKSSSHNYSGHFKTDTILCPIFEGI